MYELPSYLLWASKNGHEDLVKCLLDFGVDVNARNPASQNQYTPLHYANNEAIAKLLLDHGADVNARNQRQCVPLHNAQNAAIVKLLLDHGADVHAIDDAERIPLHYTRTEAMVKLLLDHGADVNASDRYQRTPLYFARNAAKMKLLLDHGADVNARDEDQRTPLHHMISGNVANARLLVNGGAQLTAVNEFGQNALHIAAKWAKKNICLFLVSRGLDPNIADNEGGTALTIYGNPMNPPLTDEQKQEAVNELLAARDAYFQRIRDEHWKKNWPLMNTLTSSGLRPLAVEVTALALEQASLDTSVSLTE